MRQLLFLSAILMMLTSCGGKKETKNDDAVGVKTVVVRETDGAKSTGYVGEVEAETSTACSFNSAGTVLRVLVGEGDHVGKGQLIATLDPTQSKNALAASQAILNQAQDAYRRMKLLHEQKSISEMDWVEVQSKLAQAQAAVDIAKKALKDCNITAPCSGVIGNKSMEPGMTALPAEPVCKILNINTVKVKVSIPEKEIAKIKNNTGSQIYVAAIDRTFKGGMIEKGVQADALSRTYEIRINVSNRDGALLPGMVANVTLDVNTDISTPHTSSLILVPVRSVQQSADNRNFVWVVRNAKSYRQYVTVGDVEGNDIIITSGLKVGDKVITVGYQKVSEGHGVQE